MNPEAALRAADFIGPVGGLITLAFGMGAAAGWAFCFRTMVKMGDTRIAERDIRINTLERENARFEAFFYTIGLERQLMQVRESSIRQLTPKPEADEEDKDE